MMKIVSGKDLENWLEEELIKANLVYEREGERNAYGRKASKGKYDFTIHEKAAIECKVIETQSKLTIPGLSKRTRKPIKSPKLKTHQIKALRQFDGLGLLLVYVTSESALYLITESQIRELVKRDPWKRNLKDEMEPITMEEVIRRIQNV